LGIGHWALGIGQKRLQGQRGKTHLPNSPTPQLPSLLSLISTYPKPQAPIPKPP